MFNVKRPLGGFRQKKLLISESSGTGRRGRVGIRHRLVRGYCRAASN